MSNVVQFSQARVEITAGTVTRCTVHDQDGSHSLSDMIGSRRYFVDVVEADGCRIGMWDGESRLDALLEAIECQRDFGSRIVDRTGDAI